VALSVLLIPLSIASIYALFKLNHGCFQAEQFKNIRIKMFWLEVLIQFVIYSRIMIGLIYEYTALHDYGVTDTFVMCFIGTYLLLTEFLPFLIILVGVCS